MNSDSNAEEQDIFEPVVELFNAAFDALSTVSLEGLLNRTVDPVAINHYRMSLASGTYHDSEPYEPEIAIVSRDSLGQGDVLAWREVLWTVGVRFKTLSPQEVSNKLESLRSHYGEEVNGLDSHSGAPRNESPTRVSGEGTSLSTSASCLSTLLIGNSSLVTQ